MYAWLQAQPNAHFMSQLLLHEREGLFEVLCAYLPSILVPYCVSQSYTNRNPMLKCEFESTGVRAACV